MCYTNDTLSTEKFFLFFKIFVGHMSIFGATDTPVSDFWWRQMKP